mmetsp:Transcript_79865/g.193414  ORF Transcript_79865/g.193414 Transcript_79865/m.193414 type:complete len:244 (-) Transcript_79865:63-794(-)
MRVRLLWQHAERLERQLPVWKLRGLQQRVEVEGVEQHWLRRRQPAQLVERPVSQSKAQQGEAALSRVGTLEGRFREQRVKPLAGREQDAHGQQRALSSRLVREGRGALHSLREARGDGRSLGAAEERGRQLVVVVQRRLHPFATRRLGGGGGGGARRADGGVEAKAADLALVPNALERLAQHEDRHLIGVGVGAQQILRGVVQRPAAEDLLARLHVALSAVKADADLEPVWPERSVEPGLRHR